MTETLGARRSRGRLALLVLLSFALFDCKDKVVEPPPRPAASVTAPDQVDSNEIVESASLDLFGLPLPEGFHLVSNTPTNMTAIGDLPVDRVAQFVRDRVQAQVDVGPMKTRFLRVYINKPRRVVVGLLSLEVARRGGLTAIQGSLLPTPPPRSSNSPPAVHSDDDDDDHGAAQPSAPKP